jgi:hypothetical protein
VKIYAAAVPALRKKERGDQKQDETQFTTKNGYMQQQCRRSGKRKEGIKTG